MGLTTSFVGVVGRGMVSSNNRLPAVRREAGVKNVKLEIVKGPTQAKMIHLGSAEIIVGRQSGCGLRIPSPLVSRKHCRLIQHEGLLFVEDLQSANGTRLNGAPVTEPM